MKYIFSLCVGPKTHQIASPATSFQKFSGGACPRTPLATCALLPLNCQVPPTLNLRPALTLKSLENTASSVGYLSLHMCARGTIVKYTHTLYMFHTPQYLSSVQYRYPEVCAAKQSYLDCTTVFLRQAFKKNEGLAILFSRHFHILIQEIFQNLLLSKIQSLQGCPGT